MIFNQILGGGGWSIEEVGARTVPSGDFVYNGTALGRYAFAGTSITSFVGDKVISIPTNMYPFALCNELEHISLPNLTYLGSLNFNNGDFGKLPKLKSLYIPNVTNMAGQVFTQMPLLTEVALPSFSGTLGGNALNTNQSGIVTIDIGPRAEKFFDWACNGMPTTCQNIILRRESGIVTLNNSKNTLQKSLKNYYVPEGLIDSYKADSKWSVYYNGGYCNFVAIEGSQYEHFYADGTPVN